MSYPQFPAIWKDPKLDENAPNSGLEVRIDEELDKGAVIPKMEDMKNKERKENNSKKVNQCRYNCGVSCYHLHYRLWEKTKNYKFQEFK